MSVPCAAVAQLDRVLGFEPSGRGFESLRPRQFPTYPYGMTPALEEAASAGIDLSLIEVSLGYSYDKRAHQHQAALELALELERVGRQLRGATEPAD